MADETEDPKFKVRDRRPFNPDGSPREVVEDEPKVTEATTKKEATVPPPQASAGTEPQAQSTSSAGSHLEPEPTLYNRGHEDHGHAEDTEPTQDDIDFINFIYGLASNAFANLGVMPNPVTGESSVDLETAKHFIDIIGLLEKKTKGNLSKQEESIVIELLRDLRMQYVSLVNTPQK